MHGIALSFLSTSIALCVALHSLFGAQAVRPAVDQSADGGTAIERPTSSTITANNPAGNVRAQSAAASVASQSAAAVVPTYPLKKSANNRYLVDQNNVPVLIVGDTAWSMSTLVTPSQHNTYFANRQALGFNSVLIAILSASYTASNADGRTYSGVAPFTSGSDPSTYDLATPNETYFALMDTMISLAGSYGLTIFFDPIETGSWAVTLRNNGSTKAFNYGVYLGNRYRNVPNIVWFHGDDFNYDNSTDNALVGQVMAGIASVDSNHLQTIELYSETYSNLDTDLSPYLGINLAYTYIPQYDLVRDAYNSSPTLPVLLGESTYEFEGQCTLPADTYLLRETAYWSLTSGGIGGYLYGNGYVWRSLWMSDPSTRLNSPGALQINHINTLFNGISWWNLVPDQTHAVVTAGYGTYNAVECDPRDNNYCSTAASSSTSLTYCPKNTTLTVAMSNFTGPVTARWFDPSNGTFQTVAGGPFTNSGTKNFTISSNNADGNPDWLLLLQVPDSQPPAIIYTPLGNTTSNTAIPLNVTVTDNIAVGSVSIYYAFNGGTFTSSSCPMGAMNTFNCSIPGQPSGSAVAYYVSATDTSGNSASNTSSSEPNIYTVGAATIPAGTYSNISLFDGSTLGGNVTVTSGLTLGGIVNTGASTLTIDCNGNIMGASGTNYVIGSVKKNYCGPGAFMFPVGTMPPATRTDGGTSTAYAPLETNVTAVVTIPSSLLVTVNTGTAPATPPLDVTTLQRYWTITETGDLTANLTFNYLDGDIPLGSNEGTYQLTKIEGMTATRFQPPFATVNTVLNTASINGVMNFSLWTLAAPLAPTNTEANIGGHVFDNTGAPLSGVTVSLLDTVLVQTRTISTDANGAFMFDTVLTGRQILVTPSRNGYTFNPPNRVFSHIGELTNVDFIATPDSSQVQSVVNDYDGDGKTDLSVFRPSDASWYILLTSTNTLKADQWGLGSDRIVPADYDGDRITDIAVFRPSTGAWYIHQSSTQTLRSVNWGLAGDVVMPADFDGDGQADIAVWRPSTGTWYIIDSHNGLTRTVNWGTSGDRPVAADYDGDGKADLAVWRPSNGTWYVSKSSDGTYTYEQWGIEEDRPVVGDYDGDNKSDLAVFRPSTATWYVKLSSDASTNSRAHGTAADILTPGDYDGDGKTDKAVWQLGGDWNILRSATNAATTQHWGTAGDTPAPSAYVP